MSPWWKPATAFLEPPPDGQASVEALEARLASRRERRLRIVLSNHLVRYLVLRWEKSMTRVEGEAYARHHFGELYGARAEQWSFTFERSGGASRLVAAVEGKLLADLRAMAARRRMQLTRVEPLLSAAYNQERRKVKAGASFFGVLERDRASLLLLSEGAPQRVASRRSAEPAAELERMVLAETFAGGLSEPPPLHVAHAATA